jgi:hypothetical protein
MRIAILSTLSVLGLSMIGSAEAAPRPPIEKGKGTVTCQAIGCTKPSLPTPLKPPMPPKPSPFSEACKHARCSKPAEPKPKPVIYCIKAPCGLPGKPKPRYDEAAHPSVPVVLRNSPIAVKNY